MTNRLAGLLLTGIFVLSSAGANAAGLTNLEMLGRYGELKKEVEQEMKAAAGPSARHLAHLCVALSRLKIYSELTACLARLDERIALGDTEQKADFIFVPPTDVRPLPHLLRSEMLIDFGDYPAAIAEANRALAKLPLGHLQLWGRSKLEIHLYTNLALASALGGDNAAALGHVQSLRNVDVPYIGSGTYNPIRKNGLGRAYMAMGDYERALEFIGTDFYARAVTGMVDLLSGLALSGDSVAAFSEIPRVLMLAKCLKETGKASEARDLMDHLLGHRLVADQADVLWLTLFERGRIAEAENQAPQALAFYLRAIEVIERQRASINTEASKIGFVGDKQAVYASAIGLLATLGRAAEAFDYVERSKSRALVDMLATKKDLAAPASDPAKAQLVLAQLDAADLASRTQDEPAKPGARSGARTLQVAASDLKVIAPELSTLVTVSSVPSDELQGLIGGEALVEYYYQDKDLYAFVLTRERLEVLKLDANGMADEVRALRKAIEAPDSDAWHAPSAALYARLWQPLSKLVGERRRIIVPHGALHYLPFGALRRPDGALLVDEAPLRFLPSASVLKYLRPTAPPGPPTLLILGNPDLGDPGMDLKYAEGEARAVAAIAPGSRLLLRREASESNLKKAGGFFSRIHFASHGKFQADEPLDSGLYLAGDADNNGLLTVGELYSMSLNADLVILSACETGLGKVANGDDVVGLTRGFLYAGSRSIVASLWSVDDQATAELMKSFYRNLARLPRQEALRAAQLEARRRFAHPFYWAAFQLTGRGD